MAILGSRIILHCQLRNSRINLFCYLLGLRTALDFGEIDLMCLHICNICTILCLVTTIFNEEARTGCTHAFSLPHYTCWFSGFNDTCMKYHRYQGFKKPVLYIKFSSGKH